jgi:glutathione S-transferase
VKRSEARQNATLFIQFIMLTATTTAPFAPTKPTTTRRQHRRRTSVRVAAASAGTLYDVPVSNNGARVRLISRWKNVDIDIVNPNEAFEGGIKGSAYAEINPQMKMPTFVAADGLRLPESEVISQYLLDAFADRAPSLTPASLNARACASLAVRIHDVYIAPVQGAMYRGPMDRATRAEGIKEIARQMDALEEVCARCEGPFIAGDSPSFADAAVFPTLIFMDFLLPKYFGWKSAFEGRPALEREYAAMMKDAAGKATYDEVRGGLEAWEAAGRFEKVGVVEDVADASFKWAY